jgi:hypothetical protein
MKTATEAHSEFLKELTELVAKFHEEHKDLFINDITIVDGIDGYGTKVLLGIKVEILVQPREA